VVDWHRTDSQVDTHLERLTSEDTIVHFVSELCEAWTALTLDLNVAAQVMSVMGRLCTPNMNFLRVFVHQLQTHTIQNDGWKDRRQCLTLESPDTIILPQQII